MTTIWKFPFPILGDFVLQMPADAEILFVDVQDGQPCMWAAVSNIGAQKDRRFCITGTGHPVPDGAQHVASFQQPPFVWHLWEAQP